MSKRINLTDEQILEVCKQHTFEEAARILGISFSSCWNKAHAAGLRKTPGRIKGKTSLNFKKK